jgi:hypothetical protein
MLFHHIDLVAKVAYIIKTLLFVEKYVYTQEEQKLTCTISEIWNDYNNNRHPDVNLQPSFTT